MSTVPGPDTPKPADNHIVHTVSDPMSHGYGRPTAGGNQVSGNELGGSGNVPAGPVPGYAIDWNGGAVSVGGTQAGADIGSGTTIVAGQPDATGHAVSDTSGGGTVGDSGPQGAGPGPTPNNPTGMP